MNSIRITPESEESKRALRKALANALEENQGLKSEVGRLEDEVEELLYECESLIQERNEIEQERMEYYNNWKVAEDIIRKLKDHITSIQ